MPRAVHRFLLFITTLSAFLMTLAVGVGEAQAAPIGMCADTAQSVAAPPQLFEADNAVLMNCGPDEREFKGGFPATPPERVSSTQESGEQDVVLSSDVPTTRTKKYRVPLSKATTTLPLEHRWRGLRPPQR